MSEASKQRELMCIQIGSEILREKMLDFVGREIDFENGEVYLVFDDEGDANFQALDSLQEDLKNDPEIFNQDWLSDFVEEDWAINDISLSIENDSGWYEEFLEERKPKTDTEYDEFSVWARKNAERIVSDREFEDFGFNKFDYINISKASKEAIRLDGVAHFLASYDGQEIELSDGTVMYRIN